MIWGKLIGFILGFKTLGFIGGFLGFLLGDWFDRGLKLHLHRIPRSRAVSVQQAFFTATFSVMGYLAKADGAVSQDEIRIAEKMMSRLDLNASLRHEAIALFTSGKEPDFDLQATLDHLYQECGAYRDLLRFFMEIQLEAALADGELNSQEILVLRTICNSLRFSLQEFEALRDQQRASRAFHDWFQSQFQEQTGSYHRRHYQSYPKEHYPASGDPYKVLGVSPNATTGEIKTAYRKLMNQHHPDKLAARGLPDSMIKLAKEKTQEIRAAYDWIRKAKNFR